jgi:hypothetical protein
VERLLAASVEGVANGRVFVPGVAEAGGPAVGVVAAVRLTWLPTADLPPQSAEAVLVSQQSPTGGEGR